MLCTDLDIKISFASVRNEYPGYALLLCRLLILAHGDLQNIQS